jgi:phage-related baseplate assembly protein
MSNGVQYSTRFPQLQIPTICTTDVAQIAATIISEYEGDFFTITQLAKTLAPGDPVRILLLRMAARESQYRVLLNYGFQQNFILSAVGSNLDAIGSNYGPLGARLPAAYAITTLQFTIAAPVNVDVTIPLNTIVSGSSSTVNIQFQTSTTCTIPAGSMSVTVQAQCTQVGIIGNGYQPGQITSILNLNLPYLISVTNITVSQGGVDAETDDAYAMRLALVPGAFSVAGSYQAYTYWAFTSNVAVSSATVVGPSGDINQRPPTTAAGYVDVYILLQGGVLPTSSTIAQITSFLNATTIRPLGDVVTVLPPTVVNYNVVGQYWIDPVNQNMVTSIQAQVQAAVTEFNTYTSAQIGRTINPEHLGQMIMEAGASDYQLTQPLRTLMDAGHVGIQSGTMALTYAGLQPE